MIQTIYALDEGTKYNIEDAIIFNLYPTQHRHLRYMAPSDFIFRNYSMSTIGEIDFYEITDEEIEHIKQNCFLLE